MKKPPTSIYIHIPFCKTKCPYCDFNSQANQEKLIARYFDALITEINIKCTAYSGYYAFLPINTVFIGGGTPSLISYDYYEKLFNELKKYFKLGKDCEITIELNPGTANDKNLRGYKRLGINRISIGAQSFDEKILEILGRKHSVKDTIISIEKIKEAGFANFNLDLIYSVPTMTMENWEKSILKALSFNPKHISAYSLTIEKGTPFSITYKDKEKLPSDDFSYKLYMELCRFLNEHGFVHYEISNFAKPGYESKHNLNYWQGNNFFAFGSGAYRFLNGLRTRNLKDLVSYIDNPLLEEIIEFTDDKYDKIMLNSRLNTGIDINLLQSVSSKRGNKLNNLLKDLSKEGYMELDHNKVFLTDKGLFVNNEILVQLL